MSSNVVYGMSIKKPEKQFSKKERAVEEDGTTERMGMMAISLSNCILRIGQMPGQALFPYFQQPRSNSTRRALLFPFMQKKTEIHVV